MVFIMNSLQASGTLFDNELLMRVLVPPLHPLIPKCGWLINFSVPHMLIFQNTCWCRIQSGRLWKFFSVFLICISAFEFSLYFYFSTLILTYLEKKEAEQLKDRMPWRWCQLLGEDMPVCNKCTWGNWGLGLPRCGQAR